MNLTNFLIFKKHFLRKRNWFVAFGLFAFLPCQAELFIRAGATPFTEYAAWIATHPDDQSWIKHLDSQYPTRNESQHLTELFESSQKAFLTGTLAEAKNKFKEIAELYTSNDWRPIEREAITYSMLRIYQLDKSHLGMSYLKRAASFGYDVHFEEQIFPPPVIKLWKTEIALAKKQTIQLANLKDFSGFDVIKIDGRSYSIHESESVSILPGEHRVSFLGSHSQYFSQKISSTQLQVMKLNPVVLVSGTCKNPELKGDLNIPFAAVFEDACIRNFNGHNWLAKSHSEIDHLNLQATHYNKYQESHLPAENSEATDSKSIHAKKWLWIGLGAALLTSVALIYQNNQNQIQNIGGTSNPTPDLTPVHQEGN